ncbi:MAG: hypothetical protein Q9165_004988 [Trypethelium subeluteriae]
MDPLSITCGVLTFVGAIRQAQKCVRKLRAVQNAPQEILQLAEEVADLQSIIVQVQAAVAPVADRISRAGNHTAGPHVDEGQSEASEPEEHREDRELVTRNVQRIESKLELLSSLIPEQRQSPQSRHSYLRSENWHWFKTRSKAKKIQTELSDLKVNLLIGLGSLTQPSYGPELNVKLPRTVRWESPIWGYAINGNLVAIKDMIVKGLASPWDVNGLGGSLLHYAAERRYFDLCEMLLDYGATTSQIDDLGGNPTAMAWEHFLSGNLTCEEYLKVESLFSNDEYIETRNFSVLHKTTLGLLPGRNVKSELEASTADINIRDASGRSCVSWAAARGDDTSLQILLSFGAEPNIADYEGRTPLQYAKTPGTIATLLANGAELDSADKSGRTALHWICRLDGKAAVVEALVKAGINIDAQDNSGETALCNAALAGHNEAVAILLRHNPNLGLANDGGTTPLRFALEFKSNDVLRQLLAVPSVIDELVGDYVPCRSINGTIVAHTVAQHANLEALAILVAKAGGRMKADQLCVRDKQGNTPEYYLEKRIEGMENSTEKAALIAAFMSLFQGGRIEEINDDTKDEQDDYFWDAVEVAPIAAA